MKHWKLIVLFLFLVALFTASSEQISLSPHQKAIRYLEAALNFMQQHSVNRGVIDWTNVKHGALTLAQDAQTPAQTYPVIQRVLHLLGDNHSFFLTPEQTNLFGRGESSGFGMTLSYSNTDLASPHFVLEIYPGSPADKAGVQVGDQIKLVNGVIPAGNYIYTQLKEDPSIALTLSHRNQTSSFSIQLTAATYDRNLQPQWRLLENNVGYLELPALEGGKMTSQYADIVQQDIAKLDQTGVRNWIVDLRLNTGGNMWPMLAGIGPLLGEGKTGSFVLPAPDPPQSWFYRKGQALLDKIVMAQVDKPYRLKHDAPPIAVLTSPSTGSSGEAVVVALRARSQTQSFGEPTAGVPTANTGTSLSDGAVLVITEALDADRMGNTYNSKITPDRPIQADWKLWGTTDDPTVQAAVAWLKTQKE